MTKQTQCQRLLELFQDGEWHSNIEILNKLYIWRVSARVWDLKKQGFEIEAKNGKGSRYYYRLKQTQEQLPLIAMGG